MKKRADWSTGLRGKDAMGSALLRMKRQIALVSRFLLLQIPLCYRAGSSSERTLRLRLPLSPQSGRYRDWTEPLE